eukprot:Gregarina_sp_Poly_1__9419@NODE_58_length_17191_cov_34_446508_g49_i0_p4_GENE_NODE_58_length_17191_cov_34_446508_g49_i0NODE_58_length_17191_cov_34_446508_g49_i0_p4_ORF_typecomplete_len510_score45_50_NODE_58_length_17191_cov_34_446508_g49_i0950211031
MKLPISIVGSCLVAVAHHFSHSHGCGTVGCGGTTKFGSPLLFAHAVSTAYPLIAQLPPPPPLVTVPKLLPVHEHHTTSLLQEKAVFHKTGLIQVQLPQQAPILPPAMITTQSQYAVARPKLGKVVEQTEPTYFCKRPGFVLEGQMCVQTLVETPQFLCPGGFEALDNSCTRRATYLQTCPTGYLKREAQCAKLVTASFIARCPEGSIPTDGGCERQVAHPLTPTCPEGTYDALTGNCILQSTLEARAYCPEGFQFHDGTCLQEEVYDCTDTAPLLPTAHTSIQHLAVAHQAPILTKHQHQAVAHAGHPHSHHHGRILTATRDCSVPCTAPPAVCVLQRPQPCEVVTQQAPEIRVQPTQTTVTVQKTCTRVTSTALIFACDEGVLHANRCLVKQAVAPVPTCTALGDSSYCYARQRVPAIQECPPDFTKECSFGRPCECVALEPMAFVQTCPSGFEEAMDGCYRTAQIRPQCPPGFSLQGDACVRILREPADCVFSVTYECDHSKGPCLP